MLRCALAYLRAGLSVIPCKIYFENGNTEKAKKKPLVNWKEYQHRRSTEQEIVELWKQFPDAQIGMVTGQISGICVIDIDLGAEEERIKFLCIPPTLVSNTPNHGQHCFLKMPKGAIIQSRANILGEKSHIDVRAEGGMVILAPSEYPDGRPYEWALPFEPSAIADMPDDLYKILQQRSSIAPIVQPSKTRFDGVLQGVDEGERNDAATIYIGKIISEMPQALWESACWNATVGWNTRNRPPLPESELRNTFNSIASSERVKQGATTEYVAPQPIQWKDFCNQPLSSNLWRVVDIIPAEGNTIIASPTGEKKTWVALDIARCIASGVQFLGRFDVIKGNVLYIDAEMSKTELYRRGQQLGLPENVWVLPTDDLNLNAKEGAEWLSEFLRKNDITTLVIDTLRGVAGGLNEDKAEDVRRFFTYFKKLKNMGIAVLFLDHCRKLKPLEGKEPKKDQVLGSQDKVGNAEILHMMRSDEESDEISVYIKKIRVGKAVDPFKIKMVDSKNDQGEVRTSLLYGGEIEVVKSTKKQAGKEFILNILAEEGRTKRELEEMGMAAGIAGERNIAAALDEMRNDNEVITNGKKGRANIYVLPPATEGIGIFDI